MRPKTFSSLPLRGSSLEHICWSCSRHLARQLPRATTPTGSLRPYRSFSGTAYRANTTTNSPGSNSTPSTSLASRFRSGYFVSNGLLGRFTGAKNGFIASDAASAAGKERVQSDTSPHTTPDLPHRRRQAAKRNATPATTTPTDPSGSPASNPNSELPVNASTILTDVAARQRSSFRRHLSVFLSLTKPRLTTLVVLSAMAPYALYPVPSFLASALPTDLPSLSPLTLLFLTTGTFLCSGAANALNMLYEGDTDAKMSRTRNRPLVRNLISRRAALLFAAATAITGVALLEFGVNPTVALLGGINIALYAGIYTPLKRVSAVNTWVGAIVGGIPPLMGWAAAAGESATTLSSSPADLLFTSDAVGGWLFAALLAAWQFPHFMALAHIARVDYKNAGLRMLAWTNPAHNARVALRYGVLPFVPICVGLCAAGVTEWSFALTSLPVNAWVAREAVRFWRMGGEGGSARALFWASIWHLPAVLVLALLSKKGMWGRIWDGVVGKPDEEDDDEWEDVVEDTDDGGAGLEGSIGGGRAERR